MAVKSATEIKADIVKRTRGTSYNRDFYKSLIDLADSGERVGLDIDIGAEAANVITISVQVVGADGVTALSGIKTLAVYALTDDAATAAAVTVEAGAVGTNVSATGHPQVIVSTNASGALEIDVTEDVGGSSTEAIIRFVPIDYVGAGGLASIQFDASA